MRCSVVLVAAGRGSRFGDPRNKVLLRLGGKTVLEHALEPFLSIPEIVEIVVVANAADLEEVAAILTNIAANGKSIKTVAGGPRRLDSVFQGICNTAENELVAIHDAARPLVRRETISRALEAAARSGGAVVAEGAVDTVKRAGDGKFVNLTMPRNEIFLAQTPQVFKRREFAQALERAASGPEDFTDDASVAERAGIAVEIVEGDRENIKITYPGDLERAEEILAVRAGRNPNMKYNETRVGAGYDLHRLAAGRKFILGGVEIGGEFGPLGHSDGDVLLHALADAILGAAGLDDLGTLFPDNDPRYKNASSRALLAECSARARAAGFIVSNADCIVILERPKIAVHRAAIRKSIAEILQIPEHCINVKGKTAEGLGEIGEGRAVEARCSVLLRCVAG